MAGGDDDDKTVFGGPLPGGTPFGQGRPGDAWGRPQPGGDDGGTMIGRPGQGRPGQGQPGQAAPGSASPFGDQGPGTSPFGNAAGSGQTWLGRPAPAPGPVYGDPSQIGRAPGLDSRGFFPDIGAQPAQQPARQAPRIALHEALKVRDLGAGSSSNPLLAAAASLLILLGRLRTGLVELQVAPLMEHVTREIDRFERNALTAGVNPHEALVAKYALSGTADDIVQNLPGSDRGNWQQYSMVARFFHKRDSGVGFFQEAEKAMQAPAQHYNLLELMLVCLSLGFEGQFRTMPNGAAELARIRSAIYESLRRVHPRPDEDVSVMWQPVVQDRGRRFAAIPVPAVLGVCAAALVGIFAVFATLINRDGAEAAGVMRGLHLDRPVIQIDRAAPGPAYVAEIPQLDRIREAFAAEISDGRVGVEAKGDYIAIRVGNLQLFDLGAVEVKPGFADLASRIAEVLNGESGPILIEGHTDNVPLTGRGRFKDNYQLSTARAESVAGVLSPLLDDRARVTVEGRGEDEPVADNATEEGRAENRRVEILLAREGTYGATAPDQTSGAEQRELVPHPEGQAPDSTETVN
ncbi:type VI secretion system protein TssL, long form [Paracoccus siganidrum]|uniref:Type VI secretion system protein TssL n=1 Tax=Paracoccus siganidrum TaxID=1276757 RepID=A0A419AC96_9RHOB|nr:type VI secretion system protein TssL, long form [Paracoccus siganidrum]RJL21845.1 type VI secretion system protein TssL [Paracoccus siganidrum]RMC28832.1 type VI secretion system protein TssL [Paracoccus siganidrum]